MCVGVGVAMYVGVGEVVDTCLCVGVDVGVAMYVGEGLDMWVGGYVYRYV